VRAISTSKPTPRRFRQFSLRGLLGLILIVSVLGGWWSSQVLSQRHAVDAILDSGADVRYDGGEIVWDDDVLPRTRWHGTAMAEQLAEWFGIDAIFDVIRVTNEDSYEPLSNEVVTALRRLPHLREVVLYNEVNDEVLRALGRARDLQRLKLSNATHVTNAGLVSLAEMQHLRELVLRESQITDEGLVFIAKLRSLQSLDLFGANISDAGLRHLANLKNLQSLRLDRQRCPASGDEFRARHPRCTIRFVEVDP
jgi:hypothetical protein